MAQVGIHGMAGMAVRKWAPHKEWLMLGIVLGNLLPDADNLAVAFATIGGRSTEGLHRTFTHSLFFVAGLILLGYTAARIIHKPKLGNLGLGLGIGVLMHIALDLLLWFNGVEILWPLPSWVNFWAGVAVPEWVSKLLMPMEFLFLGLFVQMILARAQKLGTDTASSPARSDRGQRPFRPVYRFFDPGLHDEKWVHGTLRRRLPAVARVGRRPGNPDADNG